MHCSTALTRTSGLQGLNLWSAPVNPLIRTGQAMVRYLTAQLRQRDEDLLAAISTVNELASKAKAAARNHI